MVVAQAKSRANTKGRQGGGECAGSGVSILCDYWTLLPQGHTNAVLHSTLHGQVLAQQLKSVQEQLADNQTEVVRAKFVAIITDINNCGSC